MPIYDKYLRQVFNLIRLKTFACFLQLLIVFVRFIFSDKLIIVKNLFKGNRVETIKYKCKTRAIPFVHHYLPSLLYTLRCRFVLCSLSFSISHTHTLIHYAHDILWIQWLRRLCKKKTTHTQTTHSIKTKFAEQNFNSHFIVNCRS